MKNALGPRDQLGQDGSSRDRPSWIDQAEPLTDVIFDAAFTIDRSFFPSGDSSVCTPLIHAEEEFNKVTLLKAPFQTQVKETGQRLEAIMGVLVREFGKKRWNL